MAAVQFLPKSAKFFLFALFIGFAASLPEKLGQKSAAPQYKKEENVVKVPAEPLSDDSDNLIYQNEAPESQVCSSSPCMNGATCVETAPDTYKCKCSPYFIGEDCAIEPVTNVALSSCGATCNSSSTRTMAGDCYSSIDGSTILDGTHWASNYEREGAWLRVDFNDFYRVQGFVIFDRHTDNRSSSLLGLQTSDLRTTEVDLMCLGTSGELDKFWQNFNLVPMITNYMNVTVLETCNTVSTDYVGFRGIKVYANEAALLNAASVSVGATCEASSSLDGYECQNAINEVEAPGAGNEWASDGEGPGAWIQVNLNVTTTVMAVGFLQRCDQASQNSNVELGFSDGSSLPITLECFDNGVGPLDCEGQYWQQFDIEPYVVTSYVRVNITDVCSTQNNGFREIRVFGLKEDGIF